MVANALYGPRIRIACRIRSVAWLPNGYTAVDIDAALGNSPKLCRMEAQARRADVVALNKEMVA